VRVSRPKVKHLTGTFRGSPLFPERADVEYVVLKWYHLEGGRATIPKKLQQRVIFTEKVLQDRVGNTAGSIIAGMVEDGCAVALDSGRFSLEKTYTYDLHEEADTSGVVP
jgi:hypothetical protein